MALAVEAEVLLGVAVEPASDRRWWAARDLGAFADGRRLRVSGATLGQAVVHDDWSGALARGDDAHPLARLAPACGGTLLGDGDGFLAVAEGRADVCLSVGGGPWDFAVPQVLVEEAGGRFSDLAGRRRIDSGDAMVSNGLVHDAALARLRATAP